MRSYAADDSVTIRHNIIRRRVIEAAARAGLIDGNIIPKEMFLASGWTEEEYAEIPELQKKLPINEHELRGETS